MNPPDYTLQARVVAASWYLKNGTPAGVELQPLADEIKAAMESAHRQGEQMAVAQCECQPETEGAA